MEIKKLTVQDIKRMDYNQLIGVTQETNRLPGGKNTVFEIVNRTYLNRESKVLEIGTSTGFTAIELSRLVKCKVVSIDINEMSLKEAKERAKNEGLINIEFKVADVNKLPFDKEEFDLVIVGNVLSLMSNRDVAFTECRRVCKREGFIAAVPMYYIKTPFENLVRKVSEAIQAKITPLYKEDWMRFFDFKDLEIYFSKDYQFDFIEEEAVNDFVKKILSRGHLNELESDAKEVLKKKYGEYMLLFRDNLSRMGYTILLLSNKRTWEDPELYTSKEVR